jgi:hypothetical protein
MIILPGPYPLASVVWRDRPQKALDVDVIFLSL